MRGDALALLVLAPALGGCARVVQAVKNEACLLDPEQPFTTVAVQPGEAVRLYWRGPDGEPFVTLDAVRGHVEAGGDRVVAVTNAGIYEPGYVPTGLYVENGEELRPLNRAEGRGNFFLKPNGVFFVTETGEAGVVAAEEWDSLAEPVRYATQSGPLLVRGGEIHPAFNVGSENCRVRSGVGVRPDGTVVLAISNGAVNFHTFARTFRDTLGAPDALYLDGGISKLAVPALGREEDGAFGPILVVVAPRPEGG